jgi:hypothetical protein
MTTPVRPKLNVINSGAAETRLAAPSILGGWSGGMQRRILSLFELDVDQATSFYEQRTIHAA